MNGGRVVLLEERLRRLEVAATNKRTKCRTLGTTNEKAYGCVQYYVQLGEDAHAVIHELTLHGTDEYTAINLGRPETPRVAIVPVEQFVFKLYVIFLDDTTIRASECLRLRIDG